MSKELTIESLKDMKREDFIKAFKNKSLWKKAKAVIFFIDYKMNGIKNVIAIPLLKETEMKVKMMEIKNLKFHKIKKTGIGQISVNNNGPDGLTANVKLKFGGLKAEILQEKAFDLFNKIKAKLVVEIAEDAEMDNSEGEDELEVNFQSSESEIQNPATEIDKTELQKKIKITIAKIVQLNKTLDLKTGLKESDIQSAKEIKNLIKEFASLLKTAPTEIKNEYAETFLKTKKIFAVIEVQLKKLKEKQEAAAELLERELDDTINEEDEEDEEKEIVHDRNSAITKNKSIMQEINELLKEVNFASL